MFKTKILDISDEIKTFHNEVSNFQIKRNNRRKRSTLCCRFFRQYITIEIKRAFWIYDVPHGKQRGEHAHRTCEELLIPIQGSFTAHIITPDKEEMIFTMNNRSEALYIPPMTWCRFSNFTIDCVCLCLASENYFKEGYINDLSTFLKEVKKA